MVDSLVIDRTACFITDDASCDYPDGWHPSAAVNADWGIAWNDEIADAAPTRLADDQLPVLPTRVYNRAQQPIMTRDTETDSTHHARATVAHAAEPSQQSTIAQRDSGRGRTWMVSRLSHRRLLEAAEGLPLPTWQKEQRQRTRQDAVATQLEQDHGAQYTRIPHEIYPGMPMYTPYSLVRDGVTLYREQYLHTLARNGTIPAYHIAGAVVFDPDGVQRVLEREAQSAQGRLNTRGRKPGPVTRQRSRTRRSRSA